MSKSGHKMGIKLSDEHKKSISISHKKPENILKSIENLSFIDNKGEKAYQWKGGRSRGYKTGYWGKEYLQWRKSIFERDSYTCQVCRKVGGYITSHHIKSFAHYPELRFDINNGITLCEVCHSLTDNYCGRAKKSKTSRNPIN